MYLAENLVVRAIHVSFGVAKSHQVADHLQKFALAAKQRVAIAPLACFKIAFRFLEAN
jgi:hypothetical protein